MQTTTVSYHRIWNLAYPIILGSIAQNIINVTDTAFLGRLGEIALGAGAIGGIFYLVLVMLGMGFGVGGQIVIARRQGENRKNRIGPTLEHMILFLLPLSLLLIVLVKNTDQWFLPLALRSEDVVDASLEYLDVRVFGLFFVYINVSLRSFFTGIARTAVITWTTLVQAAMNVFFDYVLIFGHLGFPEMGIEGAALASVIAEFFAMVTYCVFSLRPGLVKEYNLFRFRNFSASLFRRILKVASPLMLQYSISFGVWFFFFLMVENLGERELAISNIIRSIYMVLMLPLMGFSMATNTLVSYIIGLGKPGEVLSVIRKTLLICLAGIAGILLLCYINPSLVIQVYTNDMGLVRDALPSFRVISIAVFFLATGLIVFNGVSGTGKTNISFRIELVVMVLYLGLVFVLTRVPGIPVSVVWASEVFYGFLLAAFSYFYLRSGRWRGAEV